MDLDNNDHLYLNFDDVMIIDFITLTFYIHTQRRLYKKTNAHKKWRNMIRKSFLVGTGRKEEKGLACFCVLHIVGLNIVLL